MQILVRIKSAHWWHLCSAAFCWQTFRRCKQNSIDFTIFILHCGIPIAKDYIIKYAFLFPCHMQFTIYMNILCVMQCGLFTVKHKRGRELRFSECRNIFSSSQCQKRNMVIRVIIFFIFYLKILFLVNSKSLTKYSKIASRIGYGICL